MWLKWWTMLLQGLSWVVITFCYLFYTLPSLHSLLSDCEKWKLNFVVFKDFLGNLPHTHTNLTQCFFKQHANLKPLNNSKRTVVLDHYRTTSTTSIATACGFGNHYYRNVQSPREKKTLIHSIWFLMKWILFQFRRFHSIKNHICTQKYTIFQWMAVIISLFFPNRKLDTMWVGILIEFSIWLLYRRCVFLLLLLFLFLFRSN